MVTVGPDANAFSKYDQLTDLGLIGFVLQPFPSHFLFAFQS